MTSTVSPTHLGEGSGDGTTRVPTLRDRFVPPMPRPAWLGWVATLLVALFAGVLRFIRLGEPPRIYFDEIYYATDALALRTFGVEHQTIENHETVLSQGGQDIWSGGGALVVHPPLGKWMIAGGDYLWGLLPFGTAVSPTGWRVAAALVGALSVLLLARVALRMTRSVLLGCAAGLIMALDGLHFTLSRIAMLDIFVTFWVLAGFACLLADRDRTRGRLADLIARGKEPVTWLGARWWRLAAGVCFGLACGTKWSAVFFVAAFGLLTVAWDYGARRATGQDRVVSRWFLIDALPAFFQIVGVALVTYLATWTGWLLSPLGYNRGWALGQSAWPVVPEALRSPFDALRSLWHYHADMLRFHQEMSAHHDYASAPWEWILMRTPVAFHYDGEQTGCGATDCTSAVLGIGTPVVWWLSIGALVVLMGWWMTFRDWRAGSVLLGVAAGWLPWFAFPERTMFVFYALPFLPFLVLGITLSLGLLLGPDDSSPRFSQWRRVIGGVVAGVVMLLVIANFGYLYPVLSAEIIPYEAWEERMWFGTWIYGNATPE